jgi:hypothetical protein
MVVCITGVCRQTFPTPLFSDFPWLPVICISEYTGQLSIPAMVLLYVVY